MVSKYRGRHGLDDFGTLHNTAMLGPHALTYLLTSKSGKATTSVPSIEIRLVASSKTRLIAACSRAGAQSYHMPCRKQSAHEPRPCTSR